MEKMKFALVLTPDGEVQEWSDIELRLARKLAKLIPLEPGGMIVMSTDVNATAGSGFKGWAKGFMKTWYNRVMRGKQVDDEVKALLKKEGLESGWSIGNLYKGRYFSPESGDTFNEKSFSVDIRGVDFKFIKKAGRALRKKFNQEAVLVINHSNGRTFLMTS